MFRIGFGLAVAVEALRYAAYGWIDQVFITPNYLFPFPLAPVPRLPGVGVYVVFGVMGAAALGVSAGVAFRFCATIMAAALAYVFLLDASYSLDLNHLYLMVLFAGLLTCMPTGPTVPLWTVLVLRAQILVVYFFAAMAKLDPTWLAGHPAEKVVAGGVAAPVVAWFFGTRLADPVLIYGGILVDFALVALLLVRRTRKIGIVVAATFHAFNALIFPIGVFPFVAMLATMMFLDPATAAAPDVDQRGSVAPWLVAAYVVVQVLLPLRPWLYPGPPGWSEEGNFFAWRMMTLDKRGQVEISVLDPVHQATATWTLERDLTPLQIASVTTRPLLLAQYARHVADEVEAHEGVRPEVRVRLVMALGDSVEQDAIDSGRDLAAEPFSLRHADWLLPFNPELAPRSPPQ